ncbi:MAG TPA: glycosyltransferase family 1 protein [Vicinamibacterales bacterium]|nr:glycosyltransferase family 1 protein [Vicinamibacterales bacterium]
MKILVDARELTGRSTGVGRYLFELLTRWAARRDHRHDFVLAAHAEPTQARRLGLRVTATGHRAGGTWWEQAVFPGVIRREAPDLLFCPGYTAPVRSKAPIVVTIHDVSFVAHPEWFTLREGLRRRMLTRAAARKAAAILTDSSFSAVEISRRLDVEIDRIHVVPLGVPKRGTSPSAPRTERLVLFAGSVLNRRRLPDLLAAMRLVLPHIRDARLAIAGENRTYPPQDLVEEAERQNIAEAVDVLGYATDEQLDDLYRRARVFVFVSEYEGFGLTPLEALAAGIPPIVADTAVARETCGPAAMYVRPGDVNALADALRTLLLDERARVRILEAAPGVLARYSWDRAADATLRVLERAAGR